MFFDSKVHKRPADEGRENEARDILLALRLKPRLGLYRRAYVNALLVCLTSKGSEVAIYVKETLNLCAILRAKEVLSQEQYDEDLSGIEEWGRGNLGGLSAEDLAAEPQSIWTPDGPFVIEGILNEPYLQHCQRAHEQQKTDIGKEQDDQSNASIMKGESTVPRAADLFHMLVGRSIHSTPEHEQIQDTPRYRILRPRTMMRTDQRKRTACDGAVCVNVGGVPFMSPVWSQDAAVNQLDAATEVHITLVDHVRYHVLLSARSP